VQRIATLGLEVPHDFAAGPYEAIHKRLTGGAYVTPVDEAFTSSDRTEQSQTELYNQERELFGFFVTGWSAIESLCYALFAIGAMIDRKRFPILTQKDMRTIEPGKTTSKYYSAFNKTLLTESLRKTTTSQEYKDWKEIRNVLLHRITPSRNIAIRMEVSDNPPTIESVYSKGVSWWQEIPLDEATTAERRSWLAKTLGEVLHAAETFTTQRF
jgi:hypothetical protein